MLTESTDKDRFVTGSRKEVVVHKPGTAAPDGVSDALRMYVRCQGGNERKDGEGIPDGRRGTNGAAVCPTDGRAAFISSRVINVLTR